MEGLDSLIKADDRELDFVVPTRSDTGLFLHCLSVITVVIGNK